MMTLAVPVSSYSFKHPNCIVYYAKNKSNADFASTLEKYLEHKQFKNAKPLPDHKLPKGTLVARLKINYVGSLLYKDCLAKVSIMAMEGTYPSSSDRVLYKKEIKRSFPRVTFKGAERCRRAIADAFVHIPYCMTPGQ
jgi:hypothetical protein